MEKANRPISVVAGCAAILLVSGLLLHGLLQRPILTGPDIFPVFVAVLTSILLGVVIAAVIWFGKGWGRWIYVVWVLLPIVFSTFVDVTVLGRHLSEQVTNNLEGLVTSILGLSSIAAVVLLFLPASNRWFVQCK